MGFVDGDEEWSVPEIRINIVVVNFVVGDTSEQEMVGDLLHVVCGTAPVCGPSICLSIRFTSRRK